MDVWRMSNNVTYIWKPGDKVRALEAIRDNPRYRQHFFPSAMGGTRLTHKWKAERDLCLDILRNEMWMVAAKRAKLVTKEKDSPDGPVWKATQKWTSAISNPVRNLISTLKRQMTPDSTGKNTFEKDGAKKSWKSPSDVPKAMKVFLTVHPYYFLLLELMSGEKRPVLPPPRAPTVEPPSKRRVNPRLRQLNARSSKRVPTSSPELSSSPHPSHSPIRIDSSSEPESSSEEEDELHSDSTAPKRDPSSSPALTSTPTMDHPSKTAFKKSLSYVDDQLRRSASSSRKRARSPSTSSASKSSASEEEEDIKPDVEMLPPSTALEIDELDPPSPRTPSTESDDAEFDPPSPTRPRPPSRPHPPSVSIATSLSYSSSSSDDDPPPAPRPRWSAPLELGRGAPRPSLPAKVETISIYTVSSSSSESSDDSDQSEEDERNQPKRPSPALSFISFDPPSSPEPEPTHQRFSESPDTARQTKKDRPRRKKRPKLGGTEQKDAAPAISLRWFSPTITLKNYWPTVKWLMEAEPSIKKPLLAARRPKMAGSHRLNELLKAYEDLLDPRGTKHRTWDAEILRMACTNKFMTGCSVYSPTEGQLIRRLLLLGESAGMTRLNEKQFQAQLGKDNRLILLKSAPEHDPLLKHKALNASGKVKYWEMSPLSFMLVVETNFLSLVNRLRLDAA